MAEHEHEWGTIERGRIYCDAAGCSASRPVTDDEAMAFVWGDELELVVATIRAGRYRYAHEEGLQRGIAEALAAAGLPVEREVRLPGGLGRIDLVSGRVGIEVKVAGRLEDVTRQCDRYLRSDRLDAVVLATIRARHLPLRSRGARGKPFVVVSLAHGGL